MKETSYSMVGTMLSLEICREILRNPLELTYLLLFLYDSILLIFFATIPLSSCSCEKRASTLFKKAKYVSEVYTNSSMSLLALVHSHYDCDVNIDSVCKRYI